MYKRKTRGWSQHLDFMALDILCLEFSLIGAYLFNGSFSSALLRDRVFWSLAVMLAFIDLMLLVTTDAYHNVLRRDTFKELRGTIKQAAYKAAISGAGAARKFGKERTRVWGRSAQQAEDCEAIPKKSDR